jgi:hypothetical protein
MGKANEKRQACRNPPPLGKHPIAYTVIHVCVASDPFFALSHIYLHTERERDKGIEGAVSLIAPRPAPSSLLLLPPVHYT